MRWADTPQLALKMIAKPEDQSREFQFLHIPKTGGTTLNSILLRHFAPEQILRLYRLEFHTESVPLARQLAEFDQRSSEERHRIRVIVGHTGYGLHHDRPTWSEYITILREPVGRALSHFHFARSHADNRFHVEANQSGIIDFFESGIYRHLDNCQTRFLSGSELEHLLHGKEVPYGECTREMLEQAKANLRQLAAVCLLDRFDEGLMLLQHRFGWNNLFYSKLNVGKNNLSEDIAPEVRRCVESHNQLDAELYAYACKLFAEQYRAGGAELSTRLHTFKTLNAIYGAKVRWSDATVKVGKKAHKRRIRRLSDRIAQRAGLKVDTE